MASIELQATGAAASNLDLYQVNCTFYDALGRDDARYLLARMVQLLAPGVHVVTWDGRDLQGVKLKLV